MMQLRGYQTAAKDRVIEVLHNRPVLVLPTGAGKTVTASQLVKDTGRKTLWLAHRRELITQAASTLRRLEQDCGVIMAEVAPNPFAPVQVASIQTLIRRRAPEVGLVVVDECHHARATSYRKVLDGCGCPVVGLTATPFRADGRGLGEIFGEIVVGAYADDLVADGTLLEPKVFAPDQPDLGGIKVRHGDFEESALAARMTTAKLIGNLVDQFRKHAPMGARTVVFAVNVDHSKAITAQFVEAGISAEHLDGGSHVQLREDTLERWRRGETQVVSNCSLFGEGFDLPELTVLIDAQPTMSLARHLQKLGRVMRTADEKTFAIVLDHAGNHHRHGRCTQRIEYSLDDEIKARSSDREANPDRRCPNCFMLVKRTLPECPECGHIFKTEQPKAAPGELTEFRDPVPTMPIEEQQRLWDRLDRQRELYGYKDGYTWAAFKSMTGFAPNVLHGQIFDPRHASADMKRLVYVQLDAQRVKFGYKKGWTAYRWKAIFGHWPPFGWSH